MKQRVQMISLLVRPEYLSVLRLSVGTHHYVLPRVPGVGECSKWGWHSWLAQLLVLEQRTPPFPAYLRGVIAGSSVVGRCSGVRIVGKGGDWVAGLGQDDVMSIPAARGKPDWALFRDGEC